MAIRFPRNTAAKRQKALAEAEKEFARSDKTRGKQKYVNLRTDQIKERPELFQPREFSYGARSVDPDRVKELAGRISIHGELEPVLVIRIGKEWVCVSGHHRIAPYRYRNHKKPIKCEWFAGTPTEAVDESLRRNINDTLPIPMADRQEEAWRRVLLGNGSKDQISKACNVSTSTIGNMRKAKRRYEKDAEFAERVGRPLLETSWGIMKLAGHDAGETERSIEEQAATLARNINGRLSNQLSENPTVTARALAMYDPKLPKQLMGVWSGQIVRPAARNLTEPEMRRQVQVMRERADAIEADLDKQAQTRADKLEEAAQQEEQRAERHKRLWGTKFTEEDGFEIEF
jgi:hypothetical protein